MLHVCACSEGEEGGTSVLCTLRKNAIMAGRERPRKFTRCGSGGQRATYTWRTTCDIHVADNVATGSCCGECGRERPRQLAALPMQPTVWWAERKIEGPVESSVDVWLFVVCLRLP